MAKNFFARNTGISAGSPAYDPKKDLDNLVKNYFVAFNAGDIQKALSRKTGVGEVQYYEGVVSANYEQDVNRLTAVGTENMVLMSPWLSLEGMTIKPCNFPRDIRLLLDDSIGNPKKYNIDAKTNSATVPLRDLTGKEAVSARLEYAS